MFLKMDPSFEVFLELEPFDKVDFYFAQTIARETFLDHSSSELILAIAYLFLCSRLGHVCIQAKGDTLSPMIPTLQTRHGEEIALTAQILKGLDLLKNALEETKEEKPIVYSEGLFYLRRNYLKEQKLCKKITELCKASPKYSISQEEAEEYFKKTGAKLSGDQKVAIKTILSSTVSFFSGGPGTGKTYTLTEMIRLLLDVIKEKKQPLKILITAPTGKAVSRIKQLLKEKDVPFSEEIEIATLHASMKVASKKKNEMPLLYDWIIVDESSMIDLPLFESLLSKTLLGTGVCFIGDDKQLPPVETGQVFAELLSISKDGYFPSVHLTKPVRQESSDLIDLSTAIASQDVPAVQKIFSENKKEALFKEIAESNVSIEQILFEVKGKKLEEVFSYIFENEEEALRNAQNFCFISPVNKGSLGIEKINEHILNYLMDVSCDVDQICLPIIIKKTSYSLGIFNGEVGVLVKNRVSNDNDYALFFIDGEKKRLPDQLLPPFEYGFCLSAHKSQGSEYKDVFLILPESAKNFGKELLYTAITRAKERLAILSVKDTFFSMLETDTKTVSGLKKRFLKEHKKSLDRNQS